MPKTQKRIKLGFHAGTGQYRKFINGRMYYFGSDEKSALARYSFFIETGLVWKTGYRQFCRVINGRVEPVGRTIEEARQNHLELQTGQQALQPQVESAILIRTVRDVGDAYCEWLQAHHRSAASIRDAAIAFGDLIEHPDCGDIPMEKVGKSYFLRWRNHCHEKVRGSKRQPTWANKRLAFVKAAFSRCDKEGWICIPGLQNMLRSLESISGRPREKATFDPSEIRKVLDAAEPWLKTAVMLAINTGIGNTDVGQIRWKHFVAKRIGEADEIRFVMERGKTWGRRRTPLWSETIQQLENWRKLRKESGFSTSDEDLVWTTRYGTPLVYSFSHESGVTIRDNLRPHFAALLKTMGITRPGLGFYSLRHSGATWAADYATDDTSVAEGIQCYLGDAPGAIWKNYSHGVPPSLRRVIKSIREALFPGGEVHSRAAERNADSVCQSPA